MPSLGTLDFAIIGVYLSVVFLVGLVAGLKADAERFWVNRRRTSTLLLVATIVSTQVGAGAVVGIASAAYSTGLGYPVVAIIATVGGLLLVAYAAPRIKRFGDNYSAVTIAEFYRTRYGRRAELVVAVIVLLGYMSFTAAQFVATGSLLSVWGGWHVQSAIAFSSVGLVCYTAFAGVRGDIFTDVIHFTVMIAILLLVVAPTLLVDALRDWSALSSIPSHHWSPLTFGGVGFLVGGVGFGLILSLVSMEIWQRVYAATGAAQARRVFVISALLVLPLYVLAAFSGLFARALLAGVVKADEALFRLFAAILPVGLLGLGIAALLAAFLSTANSMVLVLSATITRNLLRAGGGSHASGLLRQELLLGRIVTLGCGLAGMAFALVFPDIVQLSLNAFYLIGLLFPPLIFGLAWRRTTAAGATASMLAGLAATAVSLPFVPRQAFLVGAVVAFPTIIVVSLLTRHSPSERVSLNEELQS